MPPFGSVLRWTPAQGVDTDSDCSSPAQVLPPSTGLEDAAAASSHIVDDLTGLVGDDPLIGVGVPVEGDVHAACDERASRLVEALGLAELFSRRDPRAASGCLNAMGSGRRRT